MKKQKISNEQFNVSVTSTETEEVASSEALNLLPTIDPNVSVNVDSTTTYKQPALKLSSDICLLPSSSSSRTQLITPCLLAIDTRISAVDSPSSNNICSSSSEPPSQSVSPATCFTSLSASPALTPVDTRRLSVSPTSLLLPIDVSHTLTDPPAQPILSSYKTNHDNRSFQKQWFINRPWLEYSVKNDKIYCFYCRHFGSTNPLISRTQSDAFAKGYNNWKNALDKKKGLPQHESSLAHVTATANYNEYILREKSKLNVVNVADKGRMEQIRKNRERLVKIASTIFLCGRQMIPLRGHFEYEESSNRGNFVEILKWSYSTDLVVKSIFDDSASNATYLSPYIQNELLHLMADQMRYYISEKLKNKFFALLADESRDCARHEQMSIVLRVLDNEKMKLGNYGIEEYFLGLIPLHSFDAVSLANAIVDLLKKYNIDLTLCIAMCFDGASVMSGKNAGLQTILREQFMPKAIYIHCHVHRLNLVIVDVCLSLSYACEFYTIIKNIHKYFKASGVTNERFRDAQNQLKLTYTNLKLWANIRWDSRWTSLDAILNNYQAIVLALNDLIQEGGARAVDAKGLLLVVQEPLFVVTLFVLHKLLGPIKILSDKLKATKQFAKPPAGHVISFRFHFLAENLDYGTAQELIVSIQEELCLSRDENIFEQLFGRITAFCQQNNIDLNEKSRPHRKQTVSTKLKNPVVESTIGQRDYDLNKEYCKSNIYLQLINNILDELQKRFSSNNLKILISISSLSPNSPTFLNFDSLKSFAEHLDLDVPALLNELIGVKPMLQLQNKLLANIIDLYQALYPFTEAFPTLVTLIKSAITMPVSSTTCERTFSKMKMIKTTIRNTMTDDRLSDICLIAVERDIELNFEQLIDTFADAHKNSRIMLK
ncbi:unnamed protein product [Rotaria sordida]|uniref:TTF-type domain-containing protein n=1 Tax=Rotaria sordida TaxID=392033 RepID=A0A815WSG0_9BILA|nr:unnamed protein product [Rotaria sordida]CAF1547961.1 unnamed protein product [Rotaria sordida]